VVLTVAVAATCSSTIAHASLPSAATFDYTGAEQSYTVPSGVTMLHVVAIGGHGATAGSDDHGGLGGSGARVAADIAVTAGQTLFVEVGGNGLATGAGGFNGGGNTAADGGGGGGGSDVRTCSLTAASCPAATDSLASRVLVAGAGGGGGAFHYMSTDLIHAGGTGGAAGADGQFGGSPPYSSSQGGPGRAGTENAGGDQGRYRNVPAKPGGFGSGGAGDTSGGDGGGGGGGGWFGGGGGESADSGHLGAGGGGGSSFVTSSAINAATSLDTTGTPMISITPIQGTPNVTTGAATRVATTTATLAGVVNPNGGATAYRFEYGPTSAYGSVTPWVDAGGGTSDVAAAAAPSGLLPHATYHYRLIAQSPAGASVGDDGTFSTLSPFFGGAYAPRQTDDVRRSGKTTVFVRCPAGTYGGCIGTLALKFGKGKSSTEIGHAAFTIAPGARSGTEIRLSKHGRALLRKSKRIKPLAVVTSRDAAGTRAELMKALTLAGP
jgi:hypothetical protein